MFFAPVIRRSAYGNRPVARSAFDRLFDEAFLVPLGQSGADQGITQDEKSYTVSFDVPGIAKEQLSIGIEGNVVRVETVAEAARQYKAVYELPQDIDVAASDARLENGVLTLKLGKKAPVSNVARLAIN